MVMLAIDVEELTVNSSTFSALQDSISTETLTLERIQTHSFCTVFLNYPKRLVKENQCLQNCIGGAHIHRVIDLQWIQKNAHICSFNHCHKHLKLSIQFKTVKK